MKVRIVSITSPTFQVKYYFEYLGGIGLGVTPFYSKAEIEQVAKDLEYEVVE